MMRGQDASPPSPCPGADDGSDFVPSSSANGAPVVTGTTTPLFPTSSLCRKPGSPTSSFQRQELSVDHHDHRAEAHEHAPPAQQKVRRGEDAHRYRNGDDVAAGAPIGFTPSCGGGAAPVGSRPPRTTGRSPRAQYLPSPPPRPSRRSDGDPHLGDPQSNGIPRPQRAPAGTLTPNLSGPPPRPSSPTRDRTGSGTPCALSSPWRRNVRSVRRGCSTSRTPDR